MHGNCHIELGERSLFLMKWMFAVTELKNFCIETFGTRGAFMSSLLIVKSCLVLHQLTGLGFQGLKLQLTDLPMRPKIKCWQPNIKNWLPVGGSPFFCQPFNLKGRHCNTCR